MGSLLLSAAEPSGDLLGAAVLTALGRREWAGGVSGVGGPAMANFAEFNAIGDIAQLSGAGLVELLPRLPSILAVRRTLKASIDRGPAVVALIDAPDLHLPLLKRARARGARAVQIVCPQFWAWRPRRADYLRRHADRVLCLFRFEVELLEERGVSAQWVGHPVVERAAAARLAAGPSASGRPRLVLLPGSRAHERARHTEAFIDAAKAATQGLDVQVVLSWPGGGRTPSGVEVSASSGIDLLAGADAAIVAPGTATLEAAMVGCPQVIAGALHPVTALIARRLLGVSSVGLPNLLVPGTPVREVLEDLSVSALAPAVREVLTAGRDGANALRMELEGIMGPEGFGGRVADVLCAEYEAA